MQSIGRSALQNRRNREEDSRARWRRSLGAAALDDCRKEGMRTNTKFGTHGLSTKHGVYIRKTSSGSRTVFCNTPLISFVLYSVVPSGVL